MAELPRLRVGLSLDSATFVQETRRVGAAVDRLGRDINKSTTGLVSGFNQAAGAVKAFAAAFGIALGSAAVGQLGRLAKDALDAAGNLGELASQAGVTVRQLQELQVAGLQVGVTQQQLVQSLAQFGRRVGEAAIGTGELKDTLDRYNIAVRDTSGQVRGSVEILGDLANAIKTAGSDQERLTIVSEAFGSRIGSRLLPLLKDGASGLREWADMAAEAGLVLSDELVAQADRASDSIATLQFAVAKGFQIGVVREFSGSVQITTDNLRAAREAGEFFGRAIGVAMKLAVDAVKSLQPFIETTAREFRAIADIVKRLFEFTGTPFAFAEAPDEIEATASALGTIPPILEDIGSGSGDAASEMEKLQKAVAGAQLDKKLAGADAATQKLAQTLRGIGVEFEVFNDFVEVEAELEPLATSLLRIYQDQEKALQARNRALQQFDEIAKISAQTIDRGERARRDAEEAALRDAEKQAEAQEELARRPFENALESIQSATTETFETIYSGGVKTFGDLADVIKDIFIRLAAELSSLMVFRAATTSSTGLFGAGGALAGLTGVGARGTPEVRQAGAPALAGAAALGGGIPVGYRQSFGTAPQISGWQMGLIGGTPALQPRSWWLTPQTGAASLFTSGALGFAGGSILGGLTGSSTGGSILGGLGAAGGTFFGGPLGGLAGGIGGGLLGGAIGGLFGGPSGRESGFAGGSLLGQVQGSGKPVAFIRDFDRRIIDLLDERQRAAADAMLKSAAGVSVKFQEELSEADKASLAAGRIGPIARGLGFRRTAVTGAPGARFAPEEQLAKLTQALQVQQQIKDLTSGFGQFAQQARALRRQFEEMTSSATEFGISTRGIPQAQREAGLDLIRSQLQALSGTTPTLKAQLALLDQQFQDLWRGAREIGATQFEDEIREGRFAARKALKEQFAEQARAERETARARRDAAREEQRQRQEARVGLTQQFAQMARGGGVATFRERIQDLRFDFRALSQQARELDISTNKVTAALRGAEREIREAFNAERAAARAQIFALVGNQFANELANLNAQFKEASKLARVYNLSEKGLAEARIRAIADLKRQQKAQIDALALSAVDPFQQLIDPLRSFQQQLSFESRQPAGQFQFAAEEFRRIAELARAGSTIAIQQLQGAGEAFIAEAGRFGASPAQVAARTEVANVIESVLQDLDRAQREASIGIEREVDRARRDIVDTVKELIAETRLVASEIRRLRG